MANEVVLTETMVETLEQFGTEDAERIINELENVGDFPDHVLDRLKNHPCYKLRVGDFRVLIDRDKDN
ncbi:MAG: type II toxin-antitoxin system RelE/ParE family toxin, partial [Halanaeroarchaeum sp.]